MLVRQLRRFRRHEGREPVEAIDGSVDELHHRHLRTEAHRLLGGLHRPLGRGNRLLIRSDLHLLTHPGKRLLQGRQLLGVGGDPIRLDKRGGLQGQQNVGLSPLHQGRGGLRFQVSVLNQVEHFAVQLQSPLGIEL